MFPCLDKYPSKEMKKKREKEKKRQVQRWGLTGLICRPYTLHTTRAFTPPGPTKETHKSCLCKGLESVRLWCSSLPQCPLWSHLPCCRAVTLKPEHKSKHCVPYWCQWRSAQQFLKKYRYLILGKWLMLELTLLHQEQNWNFFSWFLKLFYYHLPPKCKNGW